MAVQLRRRTTPPASTARQPKHDLLPAARFAPVPAMPGRHYSSRWPIGRSDRKGRSRSGGVSSSPCKLPSGCAARSVSSSTSKPREASRRVRTSWTALAGPDGEPSSLSRPSPPNAQQKHSRPRVPRGASTSTPYALSTQPSG
eukprot:scaffold16853_cov30-Tisochrysis_lutea.AAC.1